MSDIKSLNIAGIPVIVRPPANLDHPAPLIILWHGFGTPSSEAMLAQTLPLEEVQAWKAYPELPLFGHLMKAGNIEELMQRQLEDYPLQLLLPTIEPALPKAGVKPRLFPGRGYKPAFIYGIVLSHSKEQYSWIKERHKQYSWTEASREAQRRLDFVERAAEIIQRQPIPAILFAHGVQDKILTLEEVKTLYAALKAQYERVKQPELLSLKTFEHLKHHLDFEAAENNPQMHQDLIELQQVLAKWFSQHLTLS